MIDRSENNEFDTVGNVILVFGLFSLFPGLIFYFYAQAHFPGGKLLHGAGAVIGGFALGYMMAKVKILRVVAANILALFFVFGS